MTLSTRIAELERLAQDKRSMLLLGVEGMSRRTAERLVRELERIGDELVGLRAKQAKEAKDKRHA